MPPNQEVEIEISVISSILKAKIDEDKMGQASFLMVITGGQFAYRRKDGVFVVPVGCLKN